MKNRRDFLRGAFGLGAGLAASPRMLASPAQPREEKKDVAHVGHTTRRGGRVISVETPDIPELPFRMASGVKEFHLIAEPVKQELIPGKVVNLWGYNGTAPGPTIQVTQGDRVRIIVDNHLPEPTSMHWHGFEIPIEMDGAPGSSQDPIPPGGRFVYEFTLHQTGTFFYHSHMAMQEMMGMIGAFIMHPKEAYHPRVDHDFGLILQEFGVNLTAYLASASIIGLAISFGSQGLIQDIVIGLTLIFWDAMEVGDMVEIYASATVIGRVDQMCRSF